ncbi:hypothetical protein [Prosthecobacter sp.]|uniref:hypothetical protein n=1 Tax=Prosthecobacter sp. TaxID=1965333 RepID=UPI002ABAB452|nr:hypothetical protein [Prosthecobacter sp.]MDZ4402296.1 hypothetical protein [Prosthecobacter sp.]
MNLADCKERLAMAGVLFEDGLSEREFAKIEQEYGFCFPEDLRQFLAYALPVSQSWVDWRNGAKTEILERMQWPFEGICFDIEHNSFWLADWGEKPAVLQEAFEIARQNVAKAPKLIPIFSHRFMPDFPAEAGNPVFSVYQTDIIYYGQNLEDYLHNEFRDAFDLASGTTDENHDNLRLIRFWSDIAG